MARRERTPMHLERFATFCGPTMMAGLTGCTRLEAAELITNTGGNLGGGSTCNRWLDTMLTALGGVIVPLVDPEGAARLEAAHEAYRLRTQEYYDGGDAWDAYRRPPRYPSRTIQNFTVAGFLRAHPRGRFVLMVPGHVLLAENGKVTADTLRSRSSRRRVVKAYKMK